VDWRRRLQTLLDGPGPVMVFQPIHELAGGQRVGFEALARFPSDLSDADLELLHGPDWRLGSYTSEGPAVWFQMADQLGFGVDLEVAAICAAIDRLDDVPLGNYIAVNVGPEALVSGRLLDALGDSDLSRVVVEITEHLAIDDYAAVRRAVTALQTRHSANVCTKVPGMAADDVGAGSASLRHLLELADLLAFAKLDIALTRGIDTDQVRQALAAGMVGMGTVAGFRVVAEGVEDEAQLVTLRSLGVYAGQGWHLGRPGPLPEGDHP
jgi:EAL domain-containing protein (putative c-di-GMP-specific phosphodiesterase class I)